MTRTTKRLCTLLLTVLSLATAACSNNSTDNKADEGSKTQLDRPQLMTPTNIRANGFKMNWRPVANAAAYLCTVEDGNGMRTTTSSYTTDCRITGLSPETTYTASVQAIAFAGSEYANSERSSQTVTTTAASTDDEVVIPEGYTLVWADEFTDNTLNEEDWNIEETNSGWDNNLELQDYTRNNVTVKDGCLILTAKREASNNRDFTSGRVNTKNKQFFKYGRFDARIMMPQTANGLWPAYWMMGNDFDSVGWPRCGEIDIVEMGNAAGISAGTQDRYLNGAAHWGFYRDSAYPNYAKSSTYAYAIQDDDFHLFTCIWDENKMSMYLDLDQYPEAEPYFEMGIGTDSNDSEWETARYFRHEFFILFDLAVGGRFTGITSTNGITSELPAEMRIDYVRVFQKQ